jgi:hypothetical protein
VFEPSRSFLYGGNDGDVTILPVNGHTCFLSDAFFPKINHFCDAFFAAKPTMGLFHPLNILGIVVLLHAAYSAAQCNLIWKYSIYVFAEIVFSYLLIDKLLVSEFANEKSQGPPIDVNEIDACVERFSSIQ